MRRLHFLILLTALFLLVCGFDQADEKTIIIELDENPDKFIEAAELRLPRLEVVAEYNTIFQGVAIKGTPKELDKISRLDTVINSYPVHTYRALAESAPSYSTDAIRQRMDLPYTGKGVKVGVIDTGIDYKHPDLKKNYKGGFDVVDFDDDPMETEDKGATEHGTHVAGIIAANGKMKGIAPDAELYAYRALGPGGAGSSVQVIAAIEEAVEDGMDVINLSLGNDVNGPDWPTTKAVNKAIELGTTVIVAAGNSGPDKWTVGSPATSPEAITVGAASLSSQIPFLTVRGEKAKIPLLPLQGSVKWDITKSYPIVEGGTGRSTLHGVSGKIVLMQRGDRISFAAKALNAYRGGAEAVIIYNNQDGSFQGSIKGTELPIPVAAITKEAGEWLKKYAVESRQWVETNRQTADETLASFSSRGPVTTSWAIKPDIVAPGVDILSTVPGGYKALNGTSMASPHVAALAALMLEAHPNWTPEKIKAALMSSADLIHNSQGKAIPTEQGLDILIPRKR
ncbi:S8 family serine peptidase [Halobacillus salinarum]|uniref:S8 family serine peptidase n=1 Tax=Halobacillus salinarum TaxID=2932257 RepID=A0ABY4EMZ1_9BACI|nr:S8 family serine peptidase [Halobacillus salinarum]UOQ45350.1 S8 family serine peptidase [Halobacillus salinarum]